MFHDSVLYNLVTRNHIANEHDLPVWVIGDVHGCYDQFEELVKLIRGFQASDCIIIQLGDLIDRGPSLVEVFELVDDEDIITCIGNHELNFLQEYFGYKQCRSKARVATHDQLKKLPKATQDFIIKKMLEMKNYVTVEVDGRVWTLSHAPIRGEIDVFHDCGAGNTYCMATKPYDNSQKNADCVHGHMHWDYRDIQDQIHDLEQSWYNIDSGCVYGGELVALELKSLATLRVPGVDYASGTN